MLQTTRKSIKAMATAAALAVVISVLAAIGGMGAQNNTEECQTLASAVASLESRISSFQERLRGASPAGKAGLLRTIKNLQCQLGAKKNDLRCCRQRNGLRTEPPAAPTRVWESDLNFKMDWAASTADTKLLKVERLLRAFNNRLSDATDGQWLVGRFFIQDANSTLEEEGNSVGHIHEVRAHRSPNHGHADGRPNNPEHFHLAMANRLDNTDESARTFAGTMLMEFLHSWTGARDEYEVTSGGGRTRCPLNASPDYPNACVMWKTNDASVNELCRPENHNPNTEQGNSRGMDCYSWIAKVMRDAGHCGFIVPCNYVAGPASAPTLRFVYLTITRVRQIDRPGGEALGDFYARASMDGVRLARTKFHANDSDFSPNWLFGLAYASNQARSIPITIEIWDAVTGAPDRSCDVNPRRNKRELSLVYDPRTGAISGDAEGTSGRSISVTGGGDANRVAIDFVVTSH
jgi:hypothetical protein